MADIEPYKTALAELDLPTDRAQIIARYASFEEMNGLFEAATVVVLPYLSGWNSGVLASAYGFGKPVVATRVGGFDEVIQDEKTGLLVPVGDVESLAIGLKRVLEDGDLRERLIEGATAAGVHSSWEEVAARTTIIYDQVLEGKRDD
jgi:glycosyltransferase involved in cell wall biosynthesis